MLDGIGYDGSHLTREARLLLWECGWRPEDMIPNYNADDYANSPLYEWREVIEPSEDEILAEQADALAEQLDYDGSRLTPEQRRALFKKYWPMHLETLGLRSPQHYGHKSQCISVSETAWPGAASLVEAERLKRGYIEPDDLINRLQKLKPSDNFELRKYCHPYMSWVRPTPLEEKGFEVLPPPSEWLQRYLGKVTSLEWKMALQSASEDHQKIKDWADQHCQEMTDRWNAVQFGPDQTPLPDLQLLKDIGHSPEGTLFPWYLVKGLMTLRDQAIKTADASYREEYHIAEIERKEAIQRWSQTNPDVILADDAMSIYKTWPPDLMDELGEIDREGIRRGGRKCMAILIEAEKKMQELVTFWTDCGLVTGHRTSPQCWWQDIKAMTKWLAKPEGMQKRLDAIETDLGYSTDERDKLRCIEMSRWIESTTNSNLEPAQLDIPLPQRLLFELYLVWRDNNLLDRDKTEDKMISKICYWRMAKERQRVEEGLCTSLQSKLNPRSDKPVQITSSIRAELENISKANALSLILTPAEALQLQEILSGESRRLSKTKMSITKHHGTKKPQGIMKQYSRKASEKKYQAGVKD